MGATGKLVESPAVRELCGQLVVHPTIEARKIPWFGDDQVKKQGAGDCHRLDGAQRRDLCLAVWKMKKAG